MEKLLLGTFYTMDRDNPCFEAVGIEHGKIVFAGSRKDAERLSAKETIDYGTKAILPGFIDTHVHVIPSGIFMNGVDLSSATDIAGILDVLRDRASTTPHGEWIFGTAFQDKNIAEKRFPTRDELDQVSTNHPIWICHNDIHPFSFNSCALELLHPDPAQDGICVDASGRLTGIVTDPACMSFLDNILATLSDDVLLDGCKRIDQYAISHGVTTVFGKDSLRVLQLREAHKDSFSVEFVPMWMSNGTRDYLGLKMLSEDESLSSKACVCVFADGSFDCYSASVIEPYENRPQEFGMLLSTRKELHDFVMSAHKLGMQVSCHAIGDHGIEQVLDVYEQVLTELPKEDHRFRIEHFEMPTKASIKKAAALHIALGMQPLLIEICEGMDFSGYKCFIGERAKLCSPYRSILDAGLLVGGGTDYPVTPMEILHGAQVCMQNPNPDERITLMECLEMNTINAAKLGFLEDCKGSISVGKDADLVILSDNPFTVPLEALSQITVKETICAGNTVYTAE